ncbi:MAG: hypothetical protein J6Y71_09615 [Ruminococcus sp.]|nr:hypothetical protein [Ruminococcus sp.]
MTEKRFCVPAIIAAGVAAVLGIFSLPAESIVLSIGVIIFSIVKKNKLRPLIPVIISVLALLISVPFLLLLIHGEVTGTGTSNYWLMRLIFGKLQ